MTRALSAGISGQLSAQGSYPGFLLRATTKSGQVLRLTTLDEDFVYGSETFMSADMDLSIAFDGTIGKAASVQFGDQTIAFWVATLYRELDDANVTVYQVYNAAQGEVEELGRYRFGKPTRKVNKDGGETMSFDLDAEATALYAPRGRVQDVVDQSWMVAAGTILIVNGQKWVIDRPITSNT